MWRALQALKQHTHLLRRVGVAGVAGGGDAAFEGGAGVAGAGHLDERVALLEVGGDVGRVELDNAVEPAAASLSCAADRAARVRPGAMLVGWGAGR